MAVQAWEKPERQQGPAGHQAQAWGVQAAAGVGEPRGTGGTCTVCFVPINAAPVSSLLALQLHVTARTTWLPLIQDPEMGGRVAFGTGRGQPHLQGPLGCEHISGHLRTRYHPGEKMGAGCPGARGTFSHEIPAGKTHRVLSAPPRQFICHPRGGGSQLSWGLTTSPQVPTRILGPGLEVDLGTAGGVPALWEVPSAPGTRAAGAGRCGWAAEEAESPVSQHRSRPRKVHARRPVPPRTSVDMAGEGCCRRPGHMLARSRCSREL